MNAILSQAKFEIRSTLRNGEQLLVNALIPLGALVLFAKVQFLSDSVSHSFNALVPGVLAMALMSSALVSLGISTGFDRYYGVLKRYRTTPLTPRRWMIAKLLSVLAVQIFQWIIIGAVAAGLGWNPASGWPQALLAWVLGTAAFGGIAMIFASRLPAMVNLAVCNAVYLILAATSGMLLAPDALGSHIGRLVRWLPSGALADVLIGAIGTGTTVGGVGSWIALTLWAIVTPTIAVRVFRWQ